MFCFRALAAGQMAVEYFVPHILLVRAATMVAKAFRLFLLPQEVPLYSETVVRIVFTLYHLPIAAFVLAMTQGWILNFIYSLLLPLLEHYSPVLDSFFPLTTAAWHFCRLWMHALPVLALGLSVATLGSKLLQSIIEAMMDSFSSFNGVDYALSYHRLEYILRSPTNQRVFLSVLFMDACFFIAVFYTSVLVVWEMREHRVLIATWIIIFIQLIYVMSTGFITRERTAPPGAEVLTPTTRRRDAPLPFVTVWWRESIGRMRHLGIQILAVFGCYWYWTAGIFDSTSFIVETLLYLNLPSLFGFVALDTSCSIIRTMLSVQWVARHPRYTWHVIAMFAPQFLLMLYTVLYFSAALPVVVMMLLMMYILFGRAVNLVQEHLVHPLYGVVRWEYAYSGKPLQPQLSAAIEDAWERKAPVPALVSLDMLVNMQTMTVMRTGEEPQPIARHARKGEGLPGLIAVLRRQLPRLLLLQSFSTISGERYNNARIALKFVTRFVLLLFIMVCVAIVLQTTVTPLRPMQVGVHVDNGTMQLRHVVIQISMTASPNTSNTSDTQRCGSTITDEEDSYPAVCQREVNGVHVWELGWLSLATYISSNEDVEAYLRFVNTNLGADWEVSVEGKPLRETQRGWIGIFEFFSHSKNVSVVAVRGTDLTSAVDLLQDYVMYATPVLYHILANVVPGSIFLPAKLINDFIHVISCLDRLWYVPKVPGLPTLSGLGLATGLMRDRQFDTIVLERVDAELSRRKLWDHTEARRRVLLAGHSLGGAINHIVGSKRHLYSVAFSAPGVLLMHKRYHISRADVHRTAITFVVSNDIVPTIGWQGGELHHLECAADRREFCHAMEYMIFTMWTGCPSIRRRYSRVCGVTVQPLA